MFETTHFGIEVEFTGITRTEATEAVAKVTDGTVSSNGRCEVRAPDGRVWKVVYDSSVRGFRRSGKRLIAVHNSEYQCELVSPILTYQRDIDTVQAIIRKLRKEGAFACDTAGIHVHLDGAPHTPRSIRNFINIIASKNDLLYKALEIKADRMVYCKKMDEYLVCRMNAVKPQTFEQISEIWYAGYNESRDRHYHDSRYHFLNLHSFFQGTHTVELRGFNSELHAGKVRSYIVLALALNNQALSQKNASCRKVQAENEKFAMRTYLNRIGFIGDEFKSCREHLCQHLDGNGAWRFGSIDGKSVRTTRTEESDDA